MSSWEMLLLYVGGIPTFISVGATVILVFFLSKSKAISLKSIGTLRTMNRIVNETEKEMKLILDKTKPLTKMLFRIRVGKEYYDDIVKGR